MVVFTMRHQEIGRVGASNFGSAQPSGYFPSLHLLAEAHRPPREDSVELTDPYRAALRLLRERVLESTRLGLELERGALSKYAFARMPRDDAGQFLGCLLSDQNMLASRRRGIWEDARVDEALESGLVQGVEDTLGILHELDELDIRVWRLVCKVMDEYYRKLEAVSPDALHEKVWREI